MAEVKPLDLDSVLGKVRNRVALVGVELEGGWKQLPEGVTQLERDSSVFNGRPPKDAPYIGELPIGPIMPAAIASVMTKNYPHKMNATCGMHVHMSFDTLWYYGLLMVEEYQETILHYLMRWAKDEKIPQTHCIWERFSGESQYCRKGFWPDAQAGTKRKDYDHNRPGHRYTHIHYCGRYNTIECRTLPMFNNVPLAIRGVHKVIEITNACLYLLGKDKKRDKVNGKVELSTGIVYEETIEERI